MHAAGGGCIINATAAAPDSALHVEPRRSAARPAGGHGGCGRRSASRWSCGCSSIGAVGSRVVCRAGPPSVIPVPAGRSKPSGGNRSCRRIEEAAQSQRGQTRPKDCNKLEPAWRPAASPAPSKTNVQGWFEHKAHCLWRLECGLVEVFDRLCLDMSLPFELQVKGL